MYILVKPYPQVEKPSLKFIIPFNYTKKYVIMLELDHIYHAYEQKSIKVNPETFQKHTLIRDVILCKIFWLHMDLPGNYFD